MYLAEDIPDFTKSLAGVSLFAVIFAGTVTLQFFAIGFIVSNKGLLKAGSQLSDRFRTVIVIAQVILSASLLLIIAEITVIQEYSTILLYVINAVTLALASSLLVAFGVRFMSWRRNPRQSIGILLFSAGFLVLGASELIAIPWSFSTLVLQDMNISPESPIQSFDYSQPSLIRTIADSWVDLDYTSFVLIVLGTALLLWQYSRKLSKLKLAILIAIPLVGYASGDLAAVHTPEVEAFSQSDNYLVFVSITSFTGWVSHSFAFFYVASKMPISSIRTFLMVTAIGFVFLGYSNTVGVANAGYPPYGANSYVLLPLSVYFVVFGIYASALSLSQDVILRKKVKNLAKGDTNFLSSIGTAQLQGEIARVVGTLKEIVDKEEEELKEKSGVDNKMERDEIEDYVKQVIQEVRRSNNEER